MPAKKKQAKKKSVTKKRARAGITAGLARGTTPPGFGPVRIAPEHAEKIAEHSKNMMANIQNMLSEAGVQGLVHTVALQSAGASPCVPWPCGAQSCCYHNGVLCCR